MTKFKDELNWYWGKKVYVYPFKSPIEDFKWLSWRNVKDEDYEERLRSYYTEDAVGLNLVTGKKGICGIGMRRDSNDRHSLAILQEALGLLGLPKDYLWVLKTPHEYIIIVDVPLGFNNKDQKEFQNIRIIWEKPLQLPIKAESSYSVIFNSGFYPNGHPKSANKEIIYKCIETIKDKVLIEGIKPWWKKLLVHVGKVVILLLLFMLVGVLPVIGIPAIIVFFWINWDKIFKKKERGRRS